jgi:hypothetical protein
LQGERLAIHPQNHQQGDDRDELTEKRNGDRRQIRQHHLCGNKRDSPHQHGKKDGEYREDAFRFHMTPILYWRRFVFQQHVRQAREPMADVAAASM